MGTHSVRLAKPSALAQDMVVSTQSVPATDSPGLHSTMREWLALVTQSAREASGDDGLNEKQTAAILSVHDFLVSMILRSRFGESIWEEHDLIQARGDATDVVVSLIQGEWKPSSQPKKTNPHGTVGLDLVVETYIRAEWREILKSFDGRGSVKQVAISSRGPRNMDVSPANESANDAAVARYRSERAKRASPDKPQPTNKTRTRIEPILFADFPRQEEQMSDDGADDDGHPLVAPSDGDALSLESDGEAEPVEAPEQKMSAEDVFKEYLTHHLAAHPKAKYRDGQMHVDVLMRLIGLLIETGNIGDLKKTGQLPLAAEKYGRTFSKIGAGLFPDAPSNPSAPLRRVIERINEVLALWKRGEERKLIQESSQSAKTPEAKSAHGGEHV